MEFYFTKTRDVKSPSRAYDTDAGIDFFVPNDFTSYVLEPGQDVLIPSGIKVSVPKNVALIAFNKSGVCTKLKLRTGACVVDCGYSGEVHIHLFNDGDEPVIIKPGMKIIQFVPLQIESLKLTEIDNIMYDKISETFNRQSSGFGSSGA